MDGQFTQGLKAPGGEPRAVWGSFAPNGSSTPVVTSNGGPPGLKAFTVAYAATGAFTVTLPVGYGLVGTPTILVSAQAADLTEYFEVIQTGAYSPTTRSFVIQAKRAGSGREVAAAAGARIHFAALFNNSTGA
jgi:hypothetical protein